MNLLDIQTLSFNTTAAQNDDVATQTMSPHLLLELPSCLGRTG
jgi:hypothetical protein